MVLIFAEDGTLEIRDCMEDVIQQCEGIDVHSEVYRFYDKDGRYLRPVFDVPVSEKRFLWFFRAVDSGKYHLEPTESAEAIGEDPLWVALDETLALEPNKYFSSLEELKSSFRSRGIMVDAP